MRAAVCDISRWLQLLMLLRLLLLLVLLILGLLMVERLRMQLLWRRLSCWLLSVDDERQMGVEHAYDVERLVVVETERRKVADAYNRVAAHEAAVGRRVVVDAQYGQGHVELGAALEPEAPWYGRVVAC